MKYNKSGTTEYAESIFRVFLGFQWFKPTKFMVRYTCSDAVTHQPLQKVQSTPPKF